MQTITDVADADVQTTGRIVKRIRVKDLFGNLCGYFCSWFRNDNSQILSGFTDMAFWKKCLGGTGNGSYGIAIPECCL